MTDKALVQVENLWVRYGKLDAVRGVSFDIPAGEVFGFIGPNGAGKSSTIKVLATLLKPSGGTARLDGVDIPSHPHVVRQRIGYVPDFFGVYEDLTVQEYLHFFAAAFSIERGRRGKIVDDVLELTDLGGKLKDQVDSLSRGMKQRLSMARVLLHDPDFLLLDEPASGLDPRARIEMRELLKELRHMGKTILISSHILSELAHLCTHLGIIEAGELVAVGSVEEIFAKLSVTRLVHVQLAVQSTAEDVTPEALSQNDAQDNAIDEPPEADGVTPSDPIAQQANTSTAPLTRSSRDVIALDQAIKTIKAIPGVESVIEETDRLALQIDESQLSVESLLEKLVGAGVRLRMFQPEAIDMETAFMKLTQGKLA